MRVEEVDRIQDRDSWTGWSVRLVPSEPGGLLRVVGTPFVGTEVRIKGMSDAVASQLPWQRDTTLLDEHLPPNPDRSGVRSSGGYALRLTLKEGGTVLTNAEFEEFTPEAATTES